MSKRFQLILELIWIATGTLSLAAGVRDIITGWNRNSILLFVMAAVSFAFAWIRDRQRRKE
jgi:hypothetical protein